MANFINSADRVIMPIAIVPMTDIFQWSLHAQGWILSAFAFGYLTSQLLGMKSRPISSVYIVLLLFCRQFLGQQIGRKECPYFQRAVVEHRHFCNAFSGAEFVRANHLQDSTGFRRRTRFADNFSFVCT